MKYDKILFPLCTPKCKYENVHVYVSATYTYTLSSWVIARVSFYAYVHVCHCVFYVVHVFADFV